jgi:BASS family bile acid:Na+ symporter
VQFLAAAGRLVMRVVVSIPRTLLFWLIVISALAFWWPSGSAGSSYWFDPFLASKPGLNWLFALTMLAIGSLLPPDEVRQLARRWPAVLAGTAVQYTAMPLLAWLVSGWFGLEGPVRIGVLIAGCVPGAMASNVLTLMARGNVSYSVSLTTSATLLSPLAVPLALRLAIGSSHDSFPALELIWQLCWMVVLPVLVGYSLARLWHSWAGWAQRLGPMIANLAILWIIAVTVAANRETLLAMRSAFLVALLSLNLGGYLAGYLAGEAMRLPPPMVRALTLEIGMQNAGLGAVLAMRLFGPQAAVAPACYSFGCMLTGTILAAVWARWGATSRLHNSEQSPNGA